MTAVDLSYGETHSYEPGMTMSGNGGIVGRGGSSGGQGLARTIRCSGSGPNFDQPFKRKRLCLCPGGQPPQCSYGSNNNYRLDGRAGHDGMNGDGGLDTFMGEYQHHYQNTDLAAKVW